MQVTTIGIDLSKNVFQVDGVAKDGAAVIRKRLRRAQVLAFFAELELQGELAVSWRPQTTGFERNQRPCLSTSK
jgi:transposase